MKCSRCGKEIPPDEVHSYQGQSLCEDDYIDAISPEKHCDPWATYLSTREKGATGIAALSDMQKAIHEFIKGQGRATRQDLMAKFRLSADDLDRQLNVLKHSEMVKEHSEGDAMYLIPIPVSR